MYLDKVVEKYPTIVKKVSEMVAGDAGYIVGGAYQGELVVMLGGEATLCLVSLSNPGNFWVSGLKLNYLEVRLVPKGTVVHIVL